jgi:hypothetical protein
LLFPILLSLDWLFISRTVGGNPTKILVQNPGDAAIAQVMTSAFQDTMIDPVRSSRSTQRQFKEAGI